MDKQAAHLVDPRTAETIDVLGPTIQFLTAPVAKDDSPCVMRGTIPPGGIVPLPAHADPETCLPISGEIEGLAHSGESFRWIEIQPGDVFHVPGGAKHAWRNPSPEPAVMHIVSTGRLGSFFREVAAPAADPLRHFLETAERYGYWNATPEENAEVGLLLPA